MNAMYRIVDFGIDSLACECEKIGKGKRSQEERFQLLEIHLAFNPDAFVEEFSTLSVNFSEYECKKLLIGVATETLGKLACQGDELPLACRYSLIDVLGIRRDIEFLSYLEDNLRNENPEIRIRSLKAINQIGVVTELEKYKPFLSSCLWEERLMMAKLLRNLPPNQVYPCLEELLQDENWWVRSQAAKTIGDSKDGKARLESYISTGLDPYAIDLAKEAL